MPWRKKRGLLEGKSIGSHRAWEVKHTPQFDHVVQLHVYMHLTGTDWGVILYWDKGVNGLRALHEHEVEFDVELWSTIRQSIHEFWGGIKENKLPERVCDHSFCDRAKDCPVKDLCFEDAP